MGVSSGVGFSYQTRSSTDVQRTAPRSTAYNLRKPGAEMRERFGSPTRSMEVTERLVPQTSVRRRKGGSEMGEQWLERARSPTRPGRKQ